MSAAESQFSILFLEMILDDLFNSRHVKLYRNISETLNDYLVKYNHKYQVRKPNSPQLLANPSAKRAIIDHVNQHSVINQNRLAVKKKRSLLKKSRLSSVYEKMYYLTFLRSLYGTKGEKSLEVLKSTENEYDVVTPISDNPGLPLSYCNSVFRDYLNLPSPRPDHIKASHLEDFISVFLKIDLKYVRQISKTPRLEFILNYRKVLQDMLDSTIPLTIKEVNQLQVMNNYLKKGVAPTEPSQLSSLLDETSSKNILLKSAVLNNDKALVDSIIGSLDSIDGHTISHLLNSVGTLDQFFKFLLLLPKFNIVLDVNILNNIINNLLRLGDEKNALLVFDYLAEMNHDSDPASSILAEYSRKLDNKKSQLVSLIKSSLDLKTPNLIYCISPNLNTLNIFICHYINSGATFDKLFAFFLLAQDTLTQRLYGAEPRDFSLEPLELRHYLKLLEGFIFVQDKTWNLENLLAVTRIYLNSGLKINRKVVLQFLQGYKKVLENGRISDDIHIDIVVEKKLTEFTDYDPSQFYWSSTLDESSAVELVQYLTHLIAWFKTAGTKSAAESVLKKLAGLSPVHVTTGIS